MVYRIIVFLAIWLLFSGNNALANISITDFTMHKVKPVQDMTQPAPEQKPAENKPVEKITPKVVKTKVVKTKVKRAPVVVIKHNPKPVAKAIVKPEPKPEPKAIQEEKPGEFNKQSYIETLNKSLDKTKEIKPVETHTDYVVRPVLSLLIVIGLIFLFAMLYNKLRGINPNSLLSGKLQGMDINKFKVLATSALGQGKLIHLVEINGKQLVVGSTNNSINLLTEISTEEMAKLQAKAAGREVIEDESEPDYPDEPDEMEYTEPESYSAKYSRVYKDYLE